MVANRLSEDGNISVLLVEAGGAPSFVTGIPALAAHIQLSPYDWQHKTVRQENACLAMHNQAMSAIVVLLLSSKIINFLNKVIMLMHTQI